MVKKKCICKCKRRYKGADCSQDRCSRLRLKGGCGRYGNYQIVNGKCKCKCNKGDSPHPCNIEAQSREGMCGCAISVPGYWRPGYSIFICDTGERDTCEQHLYMHVTGYSGARCAKPPNKCPKDQNGNICGYTCYAHVMNVLFCTASTSYCIYLSSYEYQL